MLFYITESPTSFGSYRATMRQTNTRGNTYEFTVILRALRMRLCTHDVAESDIVYVYCF